MGLLGGTNVAAAKGGVHAMTYTWAVELRPRGITVNCIIPSAYTRLHDPLYRKTIEVARERGDAHVPTLEELIAAAARPEEITPLVVYLASDEADWITGQVFSMTRDRIAVWSHPVEKLQLLKNGGFTLEDVRRELPPALSSQLEPVGRPVAWMRSPDAAT